MTRADLIAALEKAEGPSEELDLTIVRTLCPVAMFDRCGDSTARPIVYHAEPIVGWKAVLPHYTASLDAALTLVPQGSLWSLSREDGPPFARVMAPNADGDYVGKTYGWSSAETPAIALCIAALKARE